MLIFDQLKRNDVYLRVLTLAVLGGVVLLLCGLYYVQILSSREYTENQISQSFRTVRIPAIRGKILDRNGYALAENRPSYTVGLYLEELREYFQAEWKRQQPPRVTKRHYLELFGWKFFSWTKSQPAYRLSRAERSALEPRVRYMVVSNIAHQLSTALQMPVELDYEEFNRHYYQRLSLPLPLVTDLTPLQVARFQEHAMQVPGLDLVVQPYRSYPFQATAAHSVGYLTRDDSSAKDEDAFFNYRLPDYRGRIGIERTFDEDLRGRAGVKSLLVNSMGYRQSETVWTPAEPGKNVVLTLDLIIQQEAEEELRKAAAFTRYPTRPALGAAVVMDPWTGDLLALASVPSFDPNEYIPYITPENYAKFTNETLRLESNRTLREHYLPGSIFKIISGLAALESGIDPTAKIYHPGYIRVGNRSIDDTSAAGEYDFERAFYRSSNSYFITNGMRAGMERMIPIAQQLHLGELTGVPTGQEVPGTFPDLERLRKGWSPGDTANICIGQGEMDVTPVQMAVMTAAIANGGKVLWPRLVDRLEPAQRHSMQDKIVFPSGRLRDVLDVNRQSIQILQNAMLADVEHENGTGRSAGGSGLRVCGKTGTAQVDKTDAYGKRYRDQTTWFASYAPYEHPRYVVVVMVESGNSGGATCAPVAREIYRALLERETSGRPSPESPAAPAFAHTREDRP